LRNGANVQTGGPGNDIIDVRGGADTIDGRGGMGQDVRRRGQRRDRHLPRRRELALQLHVVDLRVLKYRGAFGKEVREIRFLDGNSNQGDALCFEPVGRAPRYCD
jgi:hypothetical protein